MLLLLHLLKETKLHKHVIFVSSRKSCKQRNYSISGGYSSGVHWQAWSAHTWYYCEKCWQSAALKLKTEKCFPLLSRLSGRVARAAVTRHVFAPKRRRYERCECYMTVMMMVIVVAGSLGLQLPSINVLASCSSQHWGTRIDCWIIQVCVHVLSRDGYHKDYY